MELFVDILDSFEDIFRWIEDIYNSINSIYLCHFDFTTVAGNGTVGPLNLRLKLVRTP